MFLFQSVCWKRFGRLGKRLFSISLPKLIGVSMAAGDIEDFIEQNRHLAERVETFRSISESEKHWKSRREFIFRNINDYEEPHMDDLLALSMVWANNIFLGCRYSQELLDKVKEMADGIVVEDAPVFKTRDEIMKQQKR